MLSTSEPVHLTEYFDPPAHKDIDTQTIVDLRRMLTNAGYGQKLPMAAPSLGEMMT